MERVWCRSRPSAGVNTNIFIRFNFTPVISPTAAEIWRFDLRGTLKLFKLTRLIINEDSVLFKVIVGSEHVDLSACVYSEKS